MTQSQFNKISEKLGEVTSNDLDEHSNMLSTLQNELVISPDLTVDYVDGIDMWEKVEHSFTVKSLCEYIGLTADTDLTIEPNPYVVTLDSGDYTLEVLKEIIVQREAAIKIKFPITYMVDIPQLRNGEPIDEWRTIKEFKTKLAALKYAKKHFGADDNGMICILSES